MKGWEPGPEDGPPEGPIKPLLRFTMELNPVCVVYVAAIDIEADPPTVTLRIAKPQERRDGQDELVLSVGGSWLYQLTLESEDEEWSP